MNTRSWGSPWLFFQSQKTVCNKLSWYTYKYIILLAFLEDVFIEYCIVVSSNTCYYLVRKSTFCQKPASKRDFLELYGIPYWIQGWYLKNIKPFTWNSNNKLLPQRLDKSLTSLPEVFVPLRNGNDSDATLWINVRWNGILFAKLFWPTTVRKKYSDREKLFKFEA